MKKALLLTTFILATTKALAYPQFIGFGYSSCIACHYNPYGNGPLNDYGRVLATTAISSRSFYSSKTTEEEIAARSGFLYRQPKNTWLRPSGDYRGLYVKRDLGEDTSEAEVIHMQADASLVLRFGKTNNFIFSGTIGYAPIPSALEESNPEMETYRTREHYIGWRTGKKYGIYAGLMDKVFGIRVSEHTAYGRSLNQLSQNDQTHGILFHYGGEKVEAGLHYFVGNMVQEDHLRQKGFSTKIDYILDHQSTIGGSFLWSENQYLQNRSFAFHYKGAVGKGSSMLVELGHNTKTPKNTAVDADSNTYAFVQNYLKAFRGAFIIQSIEYLKEETGDYKVRFGPGLQYFPGQSIELRTEVLNIRNFSQEESTEDTWDFLAQLHLWF